MTKILLTMLQLMLNHNLINKNILLHKKTIFFGGITLKIV